MHKYFSFLFVLLSINVLGQPSPTAGRLKVTIESFKCINKSWDGFVEFDGHGNEVSVNFSYRIYSPSNPGAARKNSGGSVIFGSNVNGMTRAGTQTPDLGGINNGDVINVSLPVMDEHINADEYIIIAPTVWEWDGPEKNTLNNFNPQLEMDLDFAVGQPFPFASTPIDYRDPFRDRVGKIFDKYRSYGQAIKYHNVFKDFFCPGNTQGNRVMGISAGNFNNQCMVIYPPTLVLLDTKTLYAQHINNLGGVAGDSHAAKESRGWPQIPGINVHYTENSYAIQTSNGSYDVFLKIEFTPDYLSNPPASTTTAPPPKYSKPPVVINTISTPSENTAIPAIAGTWKGTFGYGENFNTDFYSFQLNADGTMQVLNNVGGTSANGKYTFSRNVVTGSYTYSEGSVFSFTGTVATNTMSGTWGNASNVNMGKWVMTKK